MMRREQGGGKGVSDAKALPSLEGRGGGWVAPRIPIRQLRRMPRIAPHMTAKARTLRRESTPEERAIWGQIRHIRPRFTRQLPVGGYILDFACRTLKIAVELDGSQHLGARGYDRVRTRFFETLGWRTLRFWNSDVRENADGMAAVILAAVESRLEPTHPRPLPSREGR